MGIHGKRANRTRFSDYQVKVLQEFFDKNAYPKDDDLEYLSKLLGLTPRVIVVWFQNARQKARKAYENQPSNEVLMDDVEGRFTRTPSLSYQCKKCNLEFQRYYELIRHQKQVINKSLPLFTSLYPLYDWNITYHYPLAALLQGGGLEAFCSGSEGSSCLCHELEPSRRRPKHVRCIHLQRGQQLEYILQRAQHHLSRFQSEHIVLEEKVIN